MEMDSRKPSFVLLQARFTAEKDDYRKFLGRLVADPLRPLDNSEPKDPGTIIQAEYVTVEDQNAELEVGKIINKRAQAAIQGLLSLSASSEGGHHFNIRSGVVRTYRLVDHDRCFRKLLLNDGLWEELSHPLGMMTRYKGRLYLIVGMKTFRNASVDLGLQHNKSLSACATVPIAEAMGAPIIGLDPEFSATAESQAVNTARYNSTGEQVFALEYKIVTQRSLFKQYAPEKPATLARNVMTHDWRHGVFDSDAADGSFEDDDPSGDELEASREVVANSDDRVTFFDTEVLNNSNLPADAESETIFV